MHAIRQLKHVRRQPLAGSAEPINWAQFRKSNLENMDVARNLGTKRVFYCPIVPPNKDWVASSLQDDYRWFNRPRGWDSQDRTRPSAYTSGVTTAVSPPTLPCAPYRSWATKYWFG